MRPWRESDAPILYKWASDPDVGPPASGTVMEKNGFLPTGQMVIDKSCIKAMDALYV